MLAPDEFWPDELLKKCRVKADPKEVEKCLLKEAKILG
jgi:hypothetical protein